MKIFGFGSDTRLDELGKLLKATLAKEVERLDKQKSGLGERMIRFVATGEPIGVLAEIAAIPDSTTVIFRLEGFGGDEPRPIYGMLDKVPPAAMVRYAKCHAVSMSRPSTFRYVRWAFPLSAQSPWLEAILMHASGQEMGSSGGSARSIDPSFSAGYVERMLVEDGLPPESLVTMAFMADLKNYFAEYRAEPLPRITGFAEAVARHRDAVRPAFHAKAHEQRAHALKLLKDAPVETVRCFAAEIAACATENGKLVRAAAQPLVRKMGVLALEPFQEIARRGDPAARAQALFALWDLGTEGGIAEAIAFVRGRREQEKTRSVLEAIDDMEARGTPRPSSQPLAIPDLPIIDKAQQLPGNVRAAFDDTIGRINRAIAKLQERRKVDRSVPRDLEQIADAEAGAIRDCIATGTPVRPDLAKRLGDWSIAARVLEEFRKFLRSEGIGALHVLRAFDAMGMLTLQGRGESLHYQLVEVLQDLYRLRKGNSLLQVEAAAATLGVKHGLISRAYMGTSWGTRLAVGWDGADVWPFFARHMDILRDWMRLDSGDYSFNRAAVFEAVASFPEPPSEFVAPLFEIALGAGKTDRPLAQTALEKLPGKEDRIIAALADRKAEARAVAAQWLARLRWQKAVPAIEAALRKETNDVAVGAMMSALEALDVPVDKFLDRDGLPKAAEKGLAKGIPAAIEWFPWDALPQVRWSRSVLGDGDPVSPDVLKWFIVQAAKLKTPEPHALLRRYAAMFVPAERGRFGQFVLEAWIAEDVKPIDAAEAEKRARAQAQQNHQWMTSHPQYYPNDPNLGKSVEELFAIYLPAFLRQPRGSANDSKGILAVAAACCGRDATAVAARYLKEYYGTRAAQGKALIAMLAWIEHPSATQLVLSVGNRFRTKSFQDEAVRQAEALAERKGWTVAELADRTIPSAGFDESGTLDLSYGARKFAARLAEEYKVELYNEEGKKIAALPEPRKDDDEALAKDAKKAFSGTKKEIKTILQLQTERLYEALCTQRAWPFEDWDLYLNRHPIMRRLLQGLVWAEFRDGKVVASFRPLDDGTLTDVRDEALTLAPDARIGLAHDTNLDAAAVAAWQKHLADYEVAPTFQQFGKGTYALPREKKDDREITDFRGHVLEAFAFRGRATKLGYQRGGAQDGGWFYEYHKRFPTLGLEAIVEFTGNGLPEENRLVALQALTFARVSQEQGGSPSAIALSAVPAVLLSECYNDVRLIAAEGNGFDPDWEKRTQP